jgi:hypothetical protein
MTWENTVHRKLRIPGKAVRTAMVSPPCAGVARARGLDSERFKPVGSPRESGPTEANDGVLRRQASRGSLGM